MGLFRLVAIAFAWMSIAGIAAGQAIFGVEPVATQPAATQPAASATAAAPAMDAQHRELARKNLQAAVDYLLSRQNADGGWGQPVSHPAITAMVVKALLQHGSYPVDSAPVARGIDLVLRHVQPNGGIYSPQFANENYTTSIALMMLVQANRPQDKPILAAAVKYLTGLQIVEGTTTPRGQAITRDNPAFGGTSYGEHGRPDLSNLSYTVEALHEAGVPKDDPFFANAVVFLSRVQNRGESNDQAWASVVNDGGFVYATASSGDDPRPESKSREDVVADGRHGPRSYGSMTYSGFKSMLYCNVDRDDPRIQAAYEWIRRYWRLDANPNMPDAQSREGLYYYYHVFAKALRVWGQDVIADSRGGRHNWRQELVEVLDEQRRPDGSWTNAADRWEEGMPELVTAYVALALEEALK